MVHPRGFGVPGLVSVLGAMLPAVVLGGVNQWTSIGPSGANVQAFATDPNTPATMYAGTVGGLYKTEDNGVSWASAGLAGLWVNSVVVDPLSSSTVYAVAFVAILSSFVYKSVDGGAHWSQVYSGDRSPGRLALDPSQPSTIYAAYGNCLLFCSGGVLKTTDGGKRWTKINSGLGDVAVAALAIDPVSPRTVYAGTSAGVFKSTDGGAKWFRPSFTNLFSRVTVKALAIDADSPRTVYAGTDTGGVLRSTDGGNSWVAINSGLPTMEILYWSVGITALTIAPSSPPAVYAAVWGAGVFRRTNSASTWAAVNTGLSDLGVEDLAVDSASPSTIYAGTDRSGVFEITFFEQPTRLPILQPLPRPAPIELAPRN